MRGMRQHPHRPRARRTLGRWLGWFGAVQSLVVLAAASRNLVVTPLPEQPLAVAFVAVMLLGHSALLAFLALLPCLVLTLVVPWPRVIVPLATLTAAVAAGVVLGDSVIFQQYRFHLNAEIFNLLFGGAAGEILVFPASVYAGAAAAFGGLLLAQAGLARWTWRLVANAVRPRGGRAVAALLAGAFLAQAALHAWADVAGYTPITRQGRLLPGYLPVTAESLLARLGFARARDESAHADPGRGAGLHYPLQPLRCEPPAAPLNVLVLVVDGWRFDAVGPEVTPRLEALARDGLRFADHVSGGSATRTGIFALLYGLPGTYWHAALAERRGPVLIDELYRQGYDVGIFASATLVNPEFDRTAFVRVPDLRLRSDGARASQRDGDLTDDFLAFLDAHDGGRPFFAFLFYDAPHAYDLPDQAPRPFQPTLERVNYLALGPKFDPLPFRNLYLNAVHFVDGQAGRVLDGLRQRGLDDRTLIVATGDHGQEFNENGLNYWGHDSNFSRYQVSVPLIARWPGRSAGLIEHRTSHYDVVPTLLEEVLGCTNPPADYAVGRSLFEPGGREVLLLANYTDYALVQSDRIVVVHPFGVDVLDPRSYRPIDGAAPDAAAMRTALELRGRYYR